MPIEILMLMGERMECESIQDYRSAFKYYSQALKLRETNFECHIKVGVMHMKLKEYDFAINVFKKILKIDKKNFDAMMNMGLVKLLID